MNTNQFKAVVAERAKRVGRLVAYVWTTVEQTPIWRGVVSGLSPTRQGKAVVVPPVATVTPIPTSLPEQSAVEAETIETGVAYPASVTEWVWTRPVLTLYVGETPTPAEESVVSVAPELSSKTVKELRELAWERGLKGVSRLKKAELLSRLGAATLAA